MSIAINWYINESVLRGFGGGGVQGGSENFGGVLQKCTGPLPRNIKYISGFLSLSLFDWHPCWVI
jgi:hypothetical protein